MATTLVPGDLVIHPHDTHALATVIQVMGDFVAIKDDFGVVVTDAGESLWSSRRLLALTTNRRVRVGVAF